MPKILICDDEPDVIQILQTRLQSAGYEVIEAYDGKEGVEKAVEHLPDLIIMDIMMPNMNGLEAFNMLIGKPETRNIPLLYLTATISKEEEDHLIEAYGIEVSPVIAKPFDGQELLEKVQHVLNESQ